MVHPISPLGFSEESDRDDEEWEEESREEPSSATSSIDVRTHEVARASFRFYLFSSQKVFAKHVDSSRRQMEETSRREREVERGQRRWHALRQAFRHALARTQRTKSEEKKRAAEEWTSLLPFRAGWKLEKNGSDTRMALIFITIEPILATFRRPRRVGPPRSPPAGLWYGHKPTQVDLGLPKEKRTWFSY